MAALQEVTSAFIRRLQSSQRPLSSAWVQKCRRFATEKSARENQEQHVELGGSRATVQETQDLEHSSHEITRSEQTFGEYDPVGNARKRKRQLPPSRYSFRPPKYYRGPLHPHQPPPKSDPASREYIPGPFSLPRLQQTYESTFTQDLMTLSYEHYPPGFEPAQKSERLRQWIGDSPYYKNRPLRGPRGGDVLRLLRKPITFRNVPKLERVTVHTMVKAAIEDSAHLHVAGMVMQAITNARPQTHAAKKSVAGFGIRQGQHLSVTCELQGENMYHFLSKVIDVVMPKIKDWKGVEGSSGDSSGNIAFGFKPDEVALFPEIEVNYDAYPPKMIPGCHVTIHTSATYDADARMLLSSIGIPFHGKFVN